MQFKGGLVFSIVIYTALLPFSFGGWVPSRRTPRLRRQSTLSKESTFPSFGSLAQYVCPQDANLFSRQSSTPGKLSLDELKDILLKIRLIEFQIMALIDEVMLQAGNDPASSSGITIQTVPSLREFPTTAAARLISFESAVNPSLTGLSAKASKCRNITSTSTIRIFRTTTTTVPPAPLSLTLTSSSLNLAASSTTMTFLPNAKFFNVTNSTLTSSEQNVAPSSTVTAQPSTTTDSMISVAASSTATSNLATENIISMAASTTATSTLVSMSTIPADSPSMSPTIPGGMFQESRTIPSKLKATESAQSVPQAGSATYQFDAASSSNVAVYFGQTSATGQTTLEAQCADPNIDVVILAFVISQLQGGPYPQLNFGAACGGQTRQQAAKAPGLLNCPDLASHITSCQTRYGKKVLLSIGGATTNLGFSSADQASMFGDMMWNLFGPPGNVDLDLRPFGTAEVDGFDIDVENRSPQHFGQLATTLRSHFASAAAAKTYYLSSAPQCPFPDASIPLPALLLSDFVWVQFYNNPPCEIGSSGFTASVQQWSTALEASPLTNKPRLYVGAPAFSEAGSSAFASLEGAEGIQGVVKQVESLRLANFGGVMFWDGPKGSLSIEGGKDIIAWAKEELQS